jgi:transposase DDE domain
VYTSQIIKDLSGLHIAIDGKKMCGTNPRGHGESSYIISDQRHLFEDATDAFSTRQPHKWHLEQEKGHGRSDKRNYKILPVEGNLTEAVTQRWSMVKSLIRVEHEVSKPDVQPKKETRYYISSLDLNDLSAKEVAYCIRVHWGIESRLHWQLDVTFKRRCLPCTQELFRTQSKPSS